MTFESLMGVGVSSFPLSTSRPEIIRGFRRMVDDLCSLEIPCTLIVDGSFLTVEIDPLDIDFAVCVQPQFYEECTSEQLSYLNWIRDSKEMRASHLCDCYLCVEYPEDHPDWFDGIQNKAFWAKLFSVSTVHKRVRGVGAIEIDGTTKL